MKRSSLSGPYLIALAAYVASLFLPVVRVPTFSDPPWRNVSGLEFLIEGIGSLPVVQWTPLSDDIGGYARLLLMCASIAFIFLSPLLLFRARLKRFWIWCMIFLVPVTTPFTLCFDSVTRYHLLVGYYVWAGSTVSIFLIIVAHGLSIRWSERAQARAAQL